MLKSAFKAVPFKMKLIYCFLWFYSVWSYCFLAKLSYRFSLMLNVQWSEIVGINIFVYHFEYVTSSSNKSTFFDFCMTCRKSLKIFFMIWKFSGWINNEKWICLAWIKEYNGYIVTNSTNNGASRNISENYNCNQWDYLISKQHWLLILF